MTSKAKFSKTKIDNMFRLGYKLAFETKDKKKKWSDIFALWYCAATNGHIRAQFYLATLKAPPKIVRFRSRQKF